MPRRGADHPAGDIADGFERLRIELSHMRQIAGRDGGQLGIEAIAIALKILRLRPVPGPSAGAGAMESECAADSAIAIAPGEQCIDLGRRGMGSAESKFDDTAGYGFKFFAA